ncbi:MAG TPA: DUF4266 domain-containing protein [Pseudomonadota bacterium]|nr:DUF4266 domain-containing protein [Pseudomonadota bacterium]
MCPQTGGCADPLTTLVRRPGGSPLYLALGLLAGLLPLLSGCVVVKPYQREQLAERCMAPGFGDAAEIKFRSHWEGSRHGGEGGFSYASGGCGCN